MTQQDHGDLDAWLDEARHALSPRDADRARVLTALEKQLNLPPQAPLDQLNQLPSEAAHNVGAHAAHTATRMVVQWAARLLLPVAGISAAAVIATQLYTKDAALSSKPVKPAAAVVSEPPPRVPEAPLVAADATEPPAVDDKLPPPKKRPQRKKAEVAESTPTAAQPELPPPPTAASLRKELEALRQAQQALRNGQAAQALAVLETFEREADGPGEMKEERAAAATMARCTLAQSDKTKASALYQEFVQHYPKSAYAARLRRTCLQQP